MNNTDLPEAATPSAKAPAGEATTPPTFRQLIGTLAFVSATSFGGGQMSAIRRAVVRHGKWVTKDDFLEMTAIAQVLPGANATNIAVLLGGRFAGVTGAVASLMCVVLPGFAILMLIGAALLSSKMPALVGALRACAAVAVGLTLANAVEMTLPFRKKLLELAIIAAVVAFVTVLHASLGLTLVIFLPLTLLLQWRFAR